MHMLTEIVMTMNVDIYPPTPSGVERVRPATITSNQSPSPAPKQGSIHHLVPTLNAEPPLLRQTASQPAKPQITHHYHQPPNNYQPTGQQAGKPASQPTK